MAIEINLILIGFIMFLGFIGEIIFKKTDIPTMIWLLLLGLLLGPIFGYLDQSTFLAVSEFFAAIAIIIILFDGGINMDISKIMKDAPLGGELLLLSFLFSVAIVTAIMMVLSLFIPGITILHGILLGAIVGGTSAAIVMPIIEKLKGISEKTKMILSIESAATDIFCIVVAIAVIQAMKIGSTDIVLIFKDIAANFSIGLVLGGVLGLFWIPIMRKLENERFSYVTTFGIMFLIYAITQILGGSGAIACLAFGIVLGNGKKILNIIGYHEQAYEVSEQSRSFHTLISFLIRTFFFVFLGLLVSIQDPMNILIGILITAGLLLVRPFAIKIITANKEEFKDIDKKIMGFMFPRGLAAAVLAYLPISQIPNDPVLKSFADIVFTVILATAVITTIGIIKTKKEEAETIENIEVKEKIQEEIMEQKIEKPKVEESPLVKKEREKNGPQKT